MMSYLGANGKTGVVEQEKRPSLSQMLNPMTTEAWTDPEFPPTINSIVSKYCPKDKAKRLNKEIEWKRADEIWD